uniref:Transmembrane protein 14C n=1 Tax=Acrobeloides nanus TaxID=290746 RepID=A0A914E029_9BILA
MLEINVDIIGVIYSVLIAAGGIFGYVKAGSIASLVAGVCSGLIALFGALTSNFYVLGAIALLLTAVMGYRWLDSKNFMPPGIIVILSLIMIARCVVYFVWQRNST